MNPPMDHRATPDEALDELRAKLGLLPELPVIEHVHVIGMAISPNATGDDPDESDIFLCAHDRANECTHTIVYPARSMKQMATDSENENESDGGEERLRAHTNFLIAASYN